MRNRNRNRNRNRITKSIQINLAGLRPPDTVWQGSALRKPFPWTMNNHRSWSKVCFRIWEDPPWCGSFFLFPPTRSRASIIPFPLSYSGPVSPFHYFIWNGEVSRVEVLPCAVRDRPSRRFHIGSAGADLSCKQDRRAGGVSPPCPPEHLFIFERGGRPGQGLSPRAHA